MARFVAVLCIMAFSCGEARQSVKGQASTEGACAEESRTWENTGQPILASWCMPCHSQHVVGGERIGAPVGMDFDTYTGAAQWSQRIAARLSAEAPTMPPAGGMPAEEIAELLAWIACDAPGATEPFSNPCDDVSSVASFEGCGAGPVHVTSAVVLKANGDHGCLCAVDGDLVVRGGVELSLPNLENVGGALQVTGASLVSLSMPALVSVGDIDAHKVSLQSIDLSGLVEGGALRMSALDLRELRLPELRALSGELSLTEMESLGLVTIDRLETLGGSLTLEGLPALGFVRGTQAIDVVNGDIRLIDLGLSTLDDFTELDVLGGSLVVERTQITTLNGFHRPTSIEGSILLRDNPRLVSGHGIQDIVDVAGDVIIARNPELVDWDTFHFLESVGGSFIIDDNARIVLPPLPRLTRVDADVVVTDNPALSTVEAEALGARITVGGELLVSGNGDF